jgi:spore germination protein KA
LLQSDESAKKDYISGDLLLDVPKIKELYSYPKNIDFTVREFTIHMMMGRKAVLFYIPSLTDTKLIDEEIIKPLILAPKEIIDIPSAISISAIKEEKKISGAVSQLNTGATLLLVEGINVIYVLRTSAAARRSVEKPQNETTLLGPKESFVEKADQNISLIRKKIRSEDFTVEKMKIGNRSHNEVFIIYNKELAGEKILAEGFYDKYKGHRYEHNTTISGYS